MNAFLERFEAFLITIPASLLVAIVALLVIYKMIDGEFSFIPGITVLFTLGAMLALCVKPPHPAVPWIIMIGIVALVVAFPFAEKQISHLELREIDEGQLHRAHDALKARPDNLAAEFALAKALWDSGYAEHAVAVGRRASSRIAEKKDDFGNFSLRDTFRREEYALKQWGTPPPNVGMRTCSCGHVNGPGELACAKCGSDYLFRRVGKSTSRQAVYTKLLFAWAIMGGTFAGAGASQAAPAPLNWFLFAGILITAGFVLTIFFRRQI